MDCESCKNSKNWKGKGKSRRGYCALDKGLPTIGWVKPKSVSCGGKFYDKSALEIAEERKADAEIRTEKFKNRQPGKIIDRELELNEKEQRITEKLAELEALKAEIEAAKGEAQDG